MSKKKPTVSERLKAMRWEGQVSEIRNKMTRGSFVGFIIYIVVGITGIFGGHGLIYYVVFSGGALAMFYPLLKPLRQFLQKLLKSERGRTIV